MFDTIGDVRRWEEDGLALVARIEHDPDADTSYLEQDEFTDRLAAYKRGDFSFCGVVVNVYALADIDEQESCGQASLWGIESDSGEAYFVQVAHELAGELLAGINGQG